MVGISQKAGNILERGEADTPARADEDRIVLSVGVRAADEPVEDLRIDKT